MPAVSHAPLKAEELLFLLILSTQPDGKFYSIDRIQEFAGARPIAHAQETLLKYKLIVEPARPSGQIIRGKLLITTEGHEAISKYRKHAFDDLNGRIGQRKQRSQELEKKTDIRGAAAANAEHESLVAFKERLEAAFAEWENVEEQAPPPHKPAAVAAQGRPVIGTEPPKRRTAARAARKPRVSRKAAAAAADETPDEDSAS